MSYTPIQCQLYDYIEIACLRHYKLLIKLLDGSELQGRAETTKIENKQEFMIISVEANQDQEESNTKDNRKGNTSIRLDKIKSITALDQNAEFKTVEIN